MTLRATTLMNSMRRGAPAIAAAMIAPYLGLKGLLGQIDADVERTLQQWRKEDDLGRGYINNPHTGVALELAEKYRQLLKDRAALDEVLKARFWFEIDPRCPKHGAHPPQVGMAPLPRPQLEPVSLPSSGGLLAQRTEGGGFYVGLFAGGVSHDVSSTWLPNPIGFGADAFPLARFANGLDHDPPGFLGGGQIGYDAKISFSGQGTSVSLVIGFVADIAGTTGGVSRDAVFPSLGGGRFPIQKTFSSSFVTTERLRVGFNAALVASLTVMPYVTGGFTAAQVNFSDQMFFPTSFNRGSQSEFRPGWTAGGGVDIKPANWPVTIQVQYLHTDFGEINFLAPNSALPAAFIATHHTLTQDRATIGLNISLNQLGSLLGGSAQNAGGY